MKLFLAFVSAVKVSAASFYNILKKGWVVMKKHSSKALSKKIMLSLMVAGVMSSYAAGVAGAAEVIKESYIAPGSVALEQILVSNSTVELMHGGTVSHEMQSGDLEDRTVLITGKQGSLTAKDVTFFGDMRAMEGASITLNGGTIIAGPYYEFDGTRDGNTEVGAFDTGSTINLNGVDIKCFVNAQDGGKVIVTNSDISTGEGEGIGAEHGGKIEISGANNTYYADYILADDNGSIKVNSGKVQLEQVLVSGGSTVELLGGGTVEHAFTQEEPEMVRVEGAGSSLTAKDVDFAGHVEAMDGASITLNGGSVLAGPGYGDVYATGEGSSITATNTDFTGDVYAADGASVTLNGGSVTAVVSFDGGGNPEEAYNTALFAEGEGATLSATDVDIKSAVFAVNGGKVTIVDSDITKTNDEISADRANSSIVISSSDGSNVYAVEKIRVDEGGSVTINSGKVQAEQVLVTNGGKVELLGGGSVKHVMTAEEPDDTMVHVNGAGSSLTAKDVDFTGEVSVENGGSINLTGGSIVAGPYYKEGPDGTIIDGDTTAIYAEGTGSTITASSTDIQSDILVFNGAKVIVNNSNITAESDIKVSDGSTLTISSVDGSNTYTAHYISAGGNAFLTINNGATTASKVGASGNSEVKILGGGTITAELDKITEETGKFIAVDVNDNSTFVGQNLQIKGDVKAILDSTITLTGGSVESIEKDPYGGNYQAIEVNGNSTVVGENLQIKGDVSTWDGSTITLTGGSVIGVPGENNLGEIAANSGTIEFNNVDIQSNIIARKYDSEQIGKVIVNNSNIIANQGLCVEDGSIIELNGGADNTYKIVKVEGEELSGYYLLAEGNGKIYINGGTLEADNLRSLTHGIYNIEEDDGSYVDSADGGIVLAGDGKISTMTDQIFDTAAYDAAKDTVTDGENVKVDNTAIDYQGGTLIFNDAQYTDAYLTNAKDALLAYNKDSKTSITMTGKRFDNAGEEVKDITVDEAVDKGHMEEQITVTADKNLLVGSATFTGKTHSIVIEDNVAKGFKAAVLNLGEGSDGMIITNNSEVTLGGGTITGDVLKVLQKDGTAEPNKDLKVVVGTVTDIAGVTDKTAALNIGGGTATQDTSNQLTGSVTVNAGSTLNTTGQTKITGGVTLNGAELNVLAGQLNTSITASGDATITGTVHAGTLTADEEKVAVINIGNNDKAGNVTADKMALNGGTVFLDPVWNGEDEISNASGLAVVDIDALDGNYIVGRNSLLSLGTERKDAEDVFKETGLTWGKDGISAAAYVDRNINVESGSLTVDGSLDKASTDTIAVGSVSFADNSMLMVNGANIYGEKATAAITGVNDADVDAGAKLQIANASQDGTYKILAGVSDGWDRDNIGFTNQLMGVKEIDNKGDYFNVIGESLSVRNKYGNVVVIADVIDDARANYPDSAAADFFNSAVDIEVNPTDAQQINALNNAAVMSELAGVSHAAYSASNTLTNAVADHMSLAKGLDHDTDIWAHYVHTKENIDGLAAANSGAVYDAQYNGIVVGADLYKQGKGTIGAALTYIDGKVTGSTKNEAEYYGLSIYGGVQNEDSAVIGDISYLHGKNEITQNNSGYTLTGEPKSDAFSVGVRAEQSFKAGAGKVVPYAGLRYMHLGTGNYTNSIGLSYDTDDANLFLLPVGVKYSAEHKSAGWTLRPIVEIGYVWAMGDRDSQQTVSLNGASNGFGYDITDSGSYIGRFALEAEKANVTYGLGYEYQKGDSVKANKWMVNLNWNF